MRVSVHVLCAIDVAFGVEPTRKSNFVCDKVFAYSRSLICKSHEPISLCVDYYSHIFPSLGKSHGSQLTLAH